MSSFFVSDVEPSSADEDDFFDEHPSSVFQYIDEYEVSESESLSSEASVKAEAVPSKKSFFLQEPESEEEEESSRAVLSSSKKFILEVSQICDSTKGNVASSKWSIVHKDFEQLLKRVDKHVKIGVPRAFLRLLVFLEQSISGLAPSELKDMDGLDFRALNSLKQKIKKVIPSFEDLIEQEKSSTEDLIVPKTQSLEAFEREDVERSPLELENLSHEGFLDQLSILLLQAGKKRLEKGDVQQRLEALHSVASNDEQKLYTRIHQASHLLDSIDESKDKFAQLAICYTHIQSIFGICEKFVPSSHAESLGLLSKSGCLLSIFSFLIRIDNQFTKLFQGTDFHSREYLQLLKLEADFIQIMHDSIQLFDAHAFTQQRHDLMLRIVDRVYAKPAFTFKAFRNLSQDALLKMLPTLQACAEPGIKFRASCYSAFVHSLEFDYEQAKKIMDDDIRPYSALFAHDHYAQALFNRTLTVFGICSFKAANFSDSYSSLVPIFSSHRPKEALSQLFVQKGKTPSDVFIPHHLHINIELAEVVFLLSGILTEFPLMSTVENKLKSSAIPMLKFVESFDKQLFEGRPENQHESIVLASRLILEGDVQNALEIVANLDVWKSPCAPPKDLYMQRLLESCALLYVRHNISLYESLRVSKLAAFLNCEPSMISESFKRNTSSLFDFAPSNPEIIAVKPSVGFVVNNRPVSIIELSKKAVAALEN